MRNIHLVLLFVLVVVSSCGTTNKRYYVQEKPPGFLGKIMQNTTARYNAYYNANKIYSESLISGENSYQENYLEELPVSVQDAVANSGSMSGEMDEVIKKTALIIEKKPYSKWVDDNYLLNGIAHYVNGEYEMALDIFTYVASEYKNGVIIERVGARQRVKAVNIEKLKREQAKEKLAEREREIEAQEKEAKELERERKQKAKEERRQNKYLSKDEQFELRKQAEKEGRDVSMKELLDEIREDQNKLDEQGQEVSEADKAIIAAAPTLENDNKDNPGFLAHPLAAKDAMLWLAKTYITTEKFIAANAVLTAINEDPSFPNRLNQEYYLTYADMHIRLNNLPKAIEYVQLAIEEAQRRDKGRMYYVLGQLYAENDQPLLAQQAYETVGKYHPEYNMIYQATMRNIRTDYENGEFATASYAEQLEKMSRDAKNEEFFGEVYYYLGNAHKANGDSEKAIKAYESSLESAESLPYSYANTYFELGDHYYNTSNYPQALENYELAANGLTNQSELKQEASLYSTSLRDIVDAYNSIELQDSLLHLATLSEEELTKFLEDKVQKELKQQMQDKLAVKNSEFGAETSNATSRKRTQGNRRNSSNVNANPDNFYFYDVQQTSSGFSDFKRIWGNRANVDNWRRSSARRVATESRRNAATAQAELEAGSPEAMFSSYWTDIPFSVKDQQIAQTTIQNEYLKIAEVFIEELGEFAKGKEVLQEFVETRNPTPLQRERVNELLGISQAIQQPNSDAIDAKRALLKTNNEVEKLYTEAYQQYEAGEFANVTELVQESKNYQNNRYKDKFAFLDAMSRGQLEGNGKLKVYLQEFMQQYPGSSLVQRAQQLTE